MRILITGAHGMLGRELAVRLDGKHTLWLGDIDELDICNENAVTSTINDFKPDAVINCAAFTNVDACETASSEAFRVNAEGVKNLAIACRASGALLCHISTDYVFGGASERPYTEDDPPHPLSVYGASKLAGETFIRTIAPRHLIVRTSWLFGVYGNNFIETILKLAQTRDEVSVVNDQTGCPTYAADLAAVLDALLTIQAPWGTYHVCNAGSCTWYEFALEVLACAGRTTRVVPITAQEFGRSAPRPRFSVMDTSKVSATTGMTLRHWKAAVTAYFHQREGVRA